MTRFPRAAAAVVVALLVLPLAAQQYDPLPAWPLCGRIAADPPPGWSEGDGCPAERWGDAAWSDLPLSDTFGPRDRFGVYDFHRGLDIPTAIGTPVFAVAAGVVRQATEDGLDGTVHVRHLRPGAATCGDGGGCWTSAYLHMSVLLVALDQEVAKGQLIGRSGASDTGFEHLHFEIRDAPDFDPASAWQRDCIHPLAVLPYPDQGAALLVPSVTLVDAGDPAHTRVDVSLLLDGTSELDFNRLEVTLKEVLGDGSEVVLVQPGASPDGNGYLVRPPWLDLVERNFAYTHKDSQTFPWASFATCPYAVEHGPGYDPGLHLDRNDPGDPVVGDFDGLRIRPALFNTSSTAYQLEVSFRELDGTLNDGGTLCVEVTASDVLGNHRSASAGCPLLFADGFEDGDASRWSVTSP